MSVLEDCLRDDLNERAERRIAVLDPVKLVIDNYPEDGVEECYAPNHPQRPELGTRALPFSRELWIERDDFDEHPPKGTSASRPAPRCACAMPTSIRCVGVDKDAAGSVTAVHCTYDPTTRSGTPGAEARKVKGNIHWLSVRARRARRSAPVRSSVRRAAAGQARATRTRTCRRRRALPPIVDDDDPLRGPTRSAIISTTSIRTPSASSHAYVEPVLAKAPKSALPVRASRLLRRRCQRCRGRAAGLQPRGHAARLLGQGFFRQTLIAASKRPPAVGVTMRGVRSPGRRNR